jgi:hypothetical protein
MRFIAAQLRSKMSLEAKSWWLQNANKEYNVSGNNDSAAVMDILYQNIVFDLYGVIYGQYFNKVRDCVSSKQFRVQIRVVASDCTS